MYTDASRFAVGAVLVQDKCIGLQPFGYHARKMNKHKVNYHVHGARPRRSAGGPRGGALARPSASPHLPVVGTGNPVAVPRLAR
jgi:hypothetical protein